MHKKNFFLLTMMVLALATLIAAPAMAANTNNGACPGSGVINNGAECPTWTAPIAAFTGHGPLDLAAAGCNINIFLNAYTAAKGSFHDKMIQANNNAGQNAAPNPAFAAAGEKLLFPDGTLDKAGVNPLLKMCAVIASLAPQKMVSTANLVTASG